MATSHPCKLNAGDPELNINKIKSETGKRHIKIELHVSHSDLVNSEDKNLPSPQKLLVNCQSTFYCLSANIWWRWAVILCKFTFKSCSEVWFQCMWSWSLTWTILICLFHSEVTVEPRFNEPLFNKVLDIMNNILCPSQSYSKMYGIEPRYNGPRYNEFFDITNLIQKPKRKTYLDIMNYNVSLFT